MTWNPLQLRGLSFNSPHREPASLEFQSGLNVICGASDTGKSFLVEAIDFLLGAKGPLRDIPERVGYDRERLALETVNGEIFTLERSTSGGNFRRFEGNWLLGEPDAESGTVLNQKHEHGNLHTLSTYLLSAIGLAEKYVQKNQQGTTNSLSFRNLARLIIVKESDITKELSPILSGQNTEKTKDYSVFKLMLTDLDDSALVAQAEMQAERIATQRNNNAKIEFIDELITEVQTEISATGMNCTEAEAQLLQLQKQSEAQQEILNRRQQELDVRIERRYEVMQQIKQISDRIHEISGLLSRFELLKEHYQIDLERLAAIEESGSLFVHLERVPCPLCGALPDEHHQVEVCDGDVESVVRAATAEISKVETLSMELEQTASDLRAEAEELITQKEQLDPEFQALNQKIQEITSPLRETQDTFSEIVRQSGEMQRAIDLFNRIGQLQEKKSALRWEADEPVNLVSSQVDLSKSVLDDFAQRVQHLLQAWDFPGSNRVHFDEALKDIVIGGQPRTSRGKGLRAITHAAMTIGLMEFCKERNLSHPGFVVLDSPLLAYWKPEASEDKVILEGSNLKIQFYEYLANNCSDSQIIIIENEHPPSDVSGRITSTVFTKNPEEGRYGFFPINPNS
jgi:multidrug efflux pump subunit AcrA (membrane-fusion protein)